MDVVKAIKSRRSIRKYKPDPVREDKILSCLEAARWAPSANNSQPWEFVVVRDPETRKTLAEIHTYGRFMRDSPVVLAVLADPNKSPTYHHGDAAVATQNLLLAAHSMGLGTCWMGVMDSEFEKPMKKLLGITDNLRVLCTISLGYPAERPTSPRKSLRGMVHWERYGSKRKGSGR